MLKLDELDHIAITVQDVESSATWYQDVLGLERRHEDSWGDYPVFVCAGASGLALFPKDATVEQPATGHNMRHFAFRANRVNFEKARKELQERGIEFEFQDHKIAHSIYFRDPDGYKVEITTYELD